MVAALYRRERTEACMERERADGGMHGERESGGRWEEERNRRMKMESRGGMEGRERDAENKGGKERKSEMWREGNSDGRNKRMK